MREGERKGKEKEKNEERRGKEREKKGETNI